MCDAWQRLKTQGRGGWVQGHLQLSQGDPGGQASPGQRPERDDDGRRNIGSNSKTGSDINVLFDASHYNGNDGTRRAGMVTFITARENVGDSSDDVYVGWYGTGICLKNPTRVWHGNFIITKRRKHRPRGRRWFVLERPRRDTNGGRETEVTVTSDRGV